MSRAEKAANLAGVVVPFLGLLAAIVLLWNAWVDAVDLALLAFFYLLTAVGVTVGFHRLLTHRSFQTHPRVRRAFAVLLAALTLLLPTLAGFALHGWTLEGAIRGLVWGGLVRIFLVHHVTWSVNSVCHFFGKRRFEIDDRSTNVAWLALPSLGESWHHNHHAFPRSAEHGLRRFELDPTALIIRALERMGLAWNVVRITPERQQSKLAGPRAAGRAGAGSPPVAATPP